MLRTRDRRHAHQQVNMQIRARSAQELCTSDASWYRMQGRRGRAHSSSAGGGGVAAVAHALKRAFRLVHRSDVLRRTGCQTLGLPVLHTWMAVYEGRWSNVAMIVVLHAAAGSLFVEVCTQETSTAKVPGMVQGLMSLFMWLRVPQTRCTGSPGCVHSQAAWWELATRSQPVTTQLPLTSGYWHDTMNVDAVFASGIAGKH